MVGGLLLLGAAAALLAPRRAPVKHFINLSNGIEAIQPLVRAGLPIDQISFMRIQSSHCETQDFYGILWNLDHNLLMHLALGFECRVYDYGSRGNVWENDNGEPELHFVPRALWWGLEWSRYALHHLWSLPTTNEPPLLRGVNVQSLFDEKLQMMPKPLKKRLKYYRPYVAEDLSKLRLRGFYAHTVFDGEREVYREMLGNFLQMSCNHLELQAFQPDAEALLLQEFDRSMKRGTGSAPPHSLKQRRALPDSWC